MARRLLVSLLLLAGRARAEEAARLPTVEVVGRKEAPDRAEELRQTEPGFVDVIEVGDRAEARTAADLLAEATGVQVQKLGGLGQFAQVSIRGSAADQVAVFLDGVPLQRAAGGAVNLADLPLGQIERIEVFRGPPPTYLPGMPAGGAINIVTRAPVDRFVAELAASGGSFLTRGLRGLVHLGGQRTSGMVSAEYRGSRGDYDFLDDNGTPLNPSDDQRATRRNNAFDQGAAHGRIEHRTGGGTTLRGDADLFYARRGITGIGSSQSHTAQLETRRLLALFSADTPRLLGSGRWSGSLLGDLSFTAERFTDREGEVGLGRRDTDGTTWAGGIRATVQVAPVERLLVALTLAPRLERYAVDRAFPRVEALPPSNRVSLDGSLTGDIDLHAQRLWVTPQLRTLATFDDFAAPVDPDVTATGERSAHRLLFAPMLGLRYSPREKVWLRGSVYSGVRAPAFFELFGDRGFLTGNPDLLPERTWGGEAGGSLGLERGRWRCYGEVTAYFKQTTDLIQFVQNSQYTSRAVNVGTARMWGGETRQSLEWQKRAGVSINYTFLSATDESDAPFYNGRRLPRRPTHELSLEPYVRLLSEGRLRLSSRVTYVSSTFLDRANLKQVGSRLLVALEAAVELPKGIRLQGSVENLLDVRAQDFEGFPLPGRSFFATVSYRFASGSRGP